MPELFGKSFTRREMMQRAGSMSQFGGLRRMRIAEGPGKGIDTVELATGTGLEYTILLDRGMDISSARYRGRSLCWRSDTGDRHPAFYEPEGAGWLRMFFGGLLITCGLTQVGAPCEDEGEKLGVHGRSTSLPADKVAVREDWQGNQYVMTVEGEMREHIVFGADLVCRRKITSRLGESRILIEDTVTNEGAGSCPHMILYHCNFGFPLVDDGTKFIAPSKEVIPRDDDAKAGVRQHKRMTGPIRGFREQVFFHEMRKKRSGETCVALINEGFEDGWGFGVALRYPVKNLPHFSQWRMMGERTYTCGLEPGNCRVLGRVKEREAGRLVTLRPGQSLSYRLEIEVLDGEKDLRRVKREIRAIR
jgi:hypothetical protein